MDARNLDHPTPSFLVESQLRFNPRADHEPQIEKKPPAPEARPYSILIAESTSAFAAHVIGLLQSELKFPVACTRANSCTEAAEMIDQMAPDLVVLEMAPGSNSVQVAGQIWQSRPQAKFLFWPDKCRETYFRDLALTTMPPEALYGFVVKTSSDDRFVYAVASLLLHNNAYIDPCARKAQSAQQHNMLSDIDLETLHDLALGLTDKAMAQRRLLSLRGVQNRISSLYKKLLFAEDKALQSKTASELVNMRVRLVFEAMRRGLISSEELSRLDTEFNDWMAKSTREPRT